MTSRSDVSKMLVPHHGRSSSVVSSSSHQRHRSAHLAARNVHRERAGTSVASSTGSSHDNDKLTGSTFQDVSAQLSHAKSVSARPSVHVSSASVPASNSTNTSALLPTAGSIGGRMSSGTAPTAGPTGGKSYGFLQMKCLEVLKASPNPLHIQEIQLALGPEYPVASDREFLSRLRANPRVQFDAVTKRWSFHSPYQVITSQEAILNQLQTKEFELNSEVLEYRKEITQWVNELLSNRRCRAVRGTKLSRCKVFSSESGLFCDLYSPKTRCDACQSLQGVILYQLGADYLENVVLDGDLRELWHKIPPTTVADLEVFFGVDRKRAKAAATDARAKKRKPAGGRAPRIQKIANLHVYTTEDFKEALAMEQAGELTTGQA